MHKTVLKDMKHVTHREVAISHLLGEMMCLMEREVAARY